MKLQIEERKTETIEIDFPIPSYWICDTMHFQVNENGIMNVGHNMVYWQSSDGAYFKENYDSEIIRLHKEARQISKEDFKYHLRKTILKIKKNYIP
jgi:hypothetical protein